MSHSIDYFSKENLPVSSVLTPSWSSGWEDTSVSQKVMKVATEIFKTFLLPLALLGFIVDNIKLGISFVAEKLSKKEEIAKDDVVELAPDDGIELETDEVELIDGDIEAVEDVEAEEVEGKGVEMLDEVEHIVEEIDVEDVKEKIAINFDENLNEILGELVKKHGKIKKKETAFHENESSLHETAASLSRIFEFEDGFLAHAALINYHVIGDSNAIVEPGLADEHFSITVNGSIINKDTELKHGDIVQKICINSSGEKITVAEMILAEDDFCSNIPEEVHGEIKFHRFCAVEQKTPSLGYDKTIDIHEFIEYRDGFKTGLIALTYHVKGDEIILEPNNYVMSDELIKVNGNIIEKPTVVKKEDVIETMCPASDASLSKKSEFVVDGNELIAKDQQVSFSIARTVKKFAKTFFAWSIFSCVGFWVLDNYQQYITSRDVARSLRINPGRLWLILAGDAACVSTAFAGINYYFDKKNRMSTETL
jgi:hypothetical protein